MCSIPKFQIIPHVTGWYIYDYYLDEIVSSAFETHEEAKKELETNSIYIQL